MFENNLNSINFERSSDRQLLVGTSFLDASKYISAHKAESGDFIIALNNVPLDDATNPMEDAKNVFSNNVDKDLSLSDVVVIFGLGMGYLLKRVFVNSKAKIILYEPDIRVLRYVLEYVDFSDVLSSPRVSIVFDMESCLNKVSQLYFDTEKINLIFNKSYVYLYPELLKNFSSGIINAMNNKKSDLKTIQTYSKKWVENFLLNFKYLENTRPINYLKDEFCGKTALILCAGPSLKDNIDLIKQNSDKFVVFSLNKNIDYLIQNNVIPDFVVTSDGQAFLDKFSDDSGEYANLNFILSAKCANTIFNHKTKSNWLYYPSNMASIADIVNSSDKSLLFEKTWGTTSLYAYECAKMLGFEKIIFVGLDLAFKNDERYSIDMMHYTQYLENQINFTEIENVKGEIVQTRNDYALFVKQFEMAISHYRDENVYNVSTFGAKIEGMKYVDLKEIIETFADKKYVKSFSEVYFQKTKEKWENTYKQMQNRMSEIINSAKNLNTDYNIDFNENRISFPCMYYLLSKDFFEILKIIINNPILADYFQYESLNFLHDLETKIVENLEELHDLKNQEINFIKNVNVFTAQL